MVIIIAQNAAQALRFASFNNIDNDDWVYAISAKDFKDFKGSTVVLVGGWTKKRCLLQQGLIKAGLLFFNRHSTNIVRYMEENEELWAY